MMRALSMIGPFRPAGWAAAAVLMLAALPVPLAAQVENDPAGLGGMAENAGEAVDVSADDLEILDEENQAVFSGNVVVIQGAMEMRAPRLVAIYGEGGPSDLVNFTASGGRIEMDFEDQTTISDEAFYDFEARILTLSGNVEVIQEGSTVNADRLVVDTRAGTSRFSGGPAGGDGRVNAIFEPGAGAQ